MNHLERYSESQLRKILHLKILFTVLAVLALLAIASLLRPIAVTVLALILFALLVLAFLSGSSKMFDRLSATQPLEGKNGLADGESQFIDTSSDYDAATDKSD